MRFEVFLRFKNNKSKEHAALKLCLIMSSYWLLQQDEYHMLHLVCASRTPPSSPKPTRSCSNKPQESTARPTVGQPCAS